MINRHFGRISDPGVIQCTVATEQITKTGHYLLVRSIMLAKAAYISITP